MRLAVLLTVVLFCAAATPSLGASTVPEKGLLQLHAPSVLSSDTGSPITVNLPSDWIADEPSESLTPQDAGVAAQIQQSLPLTDCQTPSFGGDSPSSQAATFRSLQWHPPSPPNSESEAGAAPATESDSTASTVQDTSSVPNTSDVPDTTISVAGPGPDPTPARGDTDTSDVSDASSSIAAPATSPDPTDVPDTSGSGPAPGPVPGGGPELSASAAGSCVQALCFVELINGQDGQSSSYSLKCGGCNRALAWNVTEWLADKLRGGVLEGVTVTTLPAKPNSSTPLMVFDGVANNVQNLVLTATAIGLEPLLPANVWPKDDFGPEFQDRLFHIFGVVNFTLTDSVIEGLAPLMTGNGHMNAGLNPAVPKLREGATVVEADARDAKWASHVRIQNCTFRNTHRVLVGSSDGYRSTFSTPIVERSGYACMLILLSTQGQGPFWVSHVDIVDTTFDNISISVPPASGYRQHLVCTHPGSQNDTVTVRGIGFANIKDTLPDHDSLDLFWADMEYADRLLTLRYTIQDTRFVGVRAALLAALNVHSVTLHNCTINDAQLSYGGIAVVSQYSQRANISHVTFAGIQLGSANDATAMNQDYYNPGIGLVKTGSRAQVHVESCMFRNVSLNPAAVSEQGSSANKSWSVSSPSAFIRTAVIAAGADARVVNSTFEDCYTPAVVYAFSGEQETIGRVYTMGTANRGTRDATVSLVLHESTFVGNMYGLYADGFQVIISSCSFTASRMFGVHVSGLPCLVMNGTVLQDAAVSVQRASNPGGAAFSFCRMGYFPLWLSGNAMHSSGEVPTEARNAAALHNITGRLADAFDPPVSVYLESVSISGVRDQPALSLLDIHKASLQRVRISGNSGSGALHASSVAGLLLLQCSIKNNTVQLVPDAAAASDASVAGGGTFTAVRNLYLLDSLFSGNSGPQAGGMLLQSCGPVSINSCTFFGNTASQSGGAVRATASESLAVDMTTLQQPGNISCMQTNALVAMYSAEFVLDLSTQTADDPNEGCPNASLGGQATNFSNNAAGVSGGAIAIDGLTLAAFSASHVNMWDNRANASGGAVAVLGANQQVKWSLSTAALLRNSAGGSGGALAFTLPVQGVLCQDCRLEGNTAGLFGGALLSSARELCVADGKHQDCLGGNIIFANNSAQSGGANVYIADAAVPALKLSQDSAGKVNYTSLAPVAIQQGRSQCTRQHLNNTGSTLRIAGPPCAIVLWSPAAGAPLLYVNNGSGLPSIRATVVDCWCSTVQNVPGALSTASLVPLTARLVFNNTVLLEQAVGVEGSVMFDKVDFNYPPESYLLTLQLSPTAESVLAANVPKPLPVNLTVQVRPCSTGEQLGRDGRCRECSTGTYGRNGQCLQCKQGATCPGGALLLPEEGWWHSAPASDVFIPCLQAEACRGSRQQLQLYQQSYFDNTDQASMSSRSLLEQVQPEYQTTMCNDGYQGHLCSNCGAGKSRTRTYQCLSCASGSKIIWVALVGILICVSFLWFVSSSTIKDSQQPWGSLKVSDATYCLTWFLQLLFVLATIPVTWPTTVAWLPKVGETVLSSFSSSTSSLACRLQPSAAMPSIAGQMMIIQMFLMLLMPVVVVLLAIFAAASKPWLRKLGACACRRKSQAMPVSTGQGKVGATGGAPLGTAVSLKQQVIITVLTCLLFFYPTILQSTMSLFVCKTLDPSGGPEQVFKAQSKHGWWMSDLDFQCYSTWHAKFALGFGLPCLLLLCLGIPLVAAAVPIRAWKRNQLQEDHYREVYGFLHWRYRDDRWYYSIVQRSWLLVLVVCVVFTSGDTMLQLFVYEAVLMASLVCLIVFKPVANTAAGHLDTFITLGALLNGFAGVFCVASNTDAAVITGSSFGMGSSGRVALGVIVVIVNVVLLLSIVAFIVNVFVDTTPAVRRMLDRMLSRVHWMQPKFSFKAPTQ